MTIPAAPLSTLTTLVKAIWAQPSAGRVWSAERSNRILFYSRARWGLADAVQLLIGDKDNGVIWCPEYFCEEAMGPLRSISKKVRFYPVLEDLRPDWSRIKAAGIKGSISSVLILVHYFGFPNDIGTAQQYCREWNIGLIEDAAHVLFPGEGCIGTAGSMVVFSPRKLLAVPEGGLLIVNKEVTLPDKFRYPDIRRD